MLCADLHCLPVPQTCDVPERLWHAAGRAHGTGPGPEEHGDGAEDGERGAGHWREAEVSPERSACSQSGHASWELELESYLSNFPCLCIPARDLTCSLFVQWCFPCNLKFSGTDVTSCFAGFYDFCPSLMC